MNVYLVPIGPDTHALYCEESAPVPTDGVTHTGWWGRLMQGFSRALADAEAERHNPTSDPAPERGRVRRFIMRKLADAVAEQRLLWYLRKEVAATLVHPAAQSGEDALALAKREFGADRDKHRRWLVIDGLLVIASAPIALLPGPNFLAYYFVFRTVGHYLSMRGAQQGLTVVQWESRAATELDDVRVALALRGEMRRARLDDLSRALGLERLASFVLSVAARYTPAS